MATKRNRTNINELRFDQLEPTQQEAILLVFDGWRYEKIAERLKVRYGTIRAWFMTGGICKPAYDQLLKDQAKANMEILEKMNDEIQKALPDALKELIRSAKRGNWQAAVALLDRGGYSPTQKIEATIDQGEKEEVMGLIKELREKVKKSPVNDKID